MTNGPRKEAMAREVESIKNAGKQRIELFKMTQRFSDNYRKQALNESYENHGEIANPFVRYTTLF